MVLWAFRIDSLSFLYLEYLSKSRGMSSKSEKLKLVSSAYWYNLSFYFSPSNWNLWFSCLLKYHRRRRYSERNQNEKERGHPCLTSFSKRNSLDKCPLFCTWEYVLLYKLPIKSTYSLKKFIFSDTWTCGFYLPCQITFLDQNVVYRLEYVFIRLVY